MTTKCRHSYRVVKKERRVPSPPPTPESNGLMTALKKIENEARQEDLQKLKQFDLDWRFGPCTGIGRLQRWERAKLHGLNPPEEIKELLQQTPHDPEYNLSLWRDYPL